MPAQGVSSRAGHAPASAKNRERQPRLCRCVPIRIKAGSKGRSQADKVTVMRGRQGNDGMKPCSRVELALESFSWHMVHGLAIECSHASRHGCMQSAHLVIA